MKKSIILNDNQVNRLQQTGTVKILQLTLKKQWFDLILSGEKTEEYREIKGYWVKRLLCQIGQTCQFFDENYKYKNSGIDITNYFQHYDAIEFTNGYGNHMPKMLIECKGITIGRGNPEWGAPDTDVFILKLGKILETKNIKQ